MIVIDTKMYLNSVQLRLSFTLVSFSCWMHQVTISCSVICFLLLLLYSYKAKKNVLKTCWHKWRRHTGRCWCVHHVWTYQSWWNKTCKKINTSDIHVNIYLEKHTNEKTVNIYLHVILTNDLHSFALCRLVFLLVQPLQPLLRSQRDLKMQGNLLLYVFCISVTSLKLNANLLSCFLGWAAITQLYDSPLHCRALNCSNIIAHINMHSTYNCAFTQMKWPPCFILC